MALPQIVDLRRCGVVTVKVRATVQVPRKVVVQSAMGSRRRVPSENLSVATPVVEFVCSAKPGGLLRDPPNDSDPRVRLRLRTRRRRRRLSMRIADPRGDMLPDPDDPREMIQADPLEGHVPTHRVLDEGFQNGSRCRSILGVAYG